MKILQLSSLFVFVFAAFKFVSAQQLPANISAACSNELAKLSSSPELNSCASFIKLSALQNATADPGPILDAYCPAPKCSDSTTSADVAELKSQCAADLMNPEVFAIKEILAFNSPVKDSFCFKNATTSQYCYLDPNSKSIFSFISGLGNTIPTDISCTDCNKAILNTFWNFFNAHNESATELPPTVNLTLFLTSVTTKCGPSFLNGTIPTGVIPSSSTPSPSPTAKSGGVTMHSPPFMLADTIIVASFSILTAYVISLI
ncbi:24408_t:CDS:2 [Cetraspora pellucida]|uniref:24408_t:CDS:1 n=1 Tax=Cetraspora pellucida TaxID=1433469 RepID=A0A9N9E0N2_9GLOM|nr:24408_t:CDS:2 [Cetraspora pellucida]